LIYIGKAKDLRNRVGSYFVNENQLNGKTRVLVRKINLYIFTIVDTEIDAWLLENSLIKKHKPKYNVLLKDDKTHPWIVIKNEPFPRVFWTRQYIKDGSRYYGPYPSVGMMHIVLDLIRELFPLRTCNLALTQENIRKGKFKICLEYQIGNCKGPCEGYQSEDDYDQNLSDIKDILNGKIAVVTNRLKESIATAAAALDFERAQLIKAKLISWTITRASLRWSTHPLQMWMYLVLLRRGLRFCQLPESHEWCYYSDTDARNETAFG
jgi:excinuclease ABC subunit C